MHHILFYPIRKNLQVYSILQSFFFSGEFQDSEIVELQNEVTRLMDEFKVFFNIWGIFYIRIRSNTYKTNIATSKTFVNKGMKESIQKCFFKRYVIRASVVHFR